MMPTDVPHPSWCDPRRCHVSLREDLEPLLVHEGEYQKLLYRSVIVFQCQVLTDNLISVTSTCSPMVKIEGEPIDDAGFRPDRARIWGEVLHDAGVAAESGGLPYVEEFWRMGGVW